MDIKAFIQQLFDLSFNDLFRGRLIPIFYILSLAGVALKRVMIVLREFAQGDASGVILSTLNGVFQLVLAVVVLRILCEALIALHDLAANMRKLSGIASKQ